MKVLFSADWHLGYVLGGANRQPRLGDQLRQLELIARYCEEHDVDVLAVAGDVFEAQEKGKAREAAEGMMEALAAPLRRGMRLIAIAGNHDRDYFFETANVWLGAGAARDSVLLRTRPDLVTVSARDEKVNFALLPFPTPARYDLHADDGGGVAQRNEQIARRFIEEMEGLRKRAAEQRLPCVLLTHLTVEGTTVRAHSISPRDDVIVPFAAFPSFELTVIGHIHKGEQKGGGHFYYVGALDRMDVGERDYAPRVLLADIGPQGVRSIESLPLDPTPIEAVSATCEDDLHAAAARLERPRETLVKLTLNVPYGTHVAGLLAAARELFPRLYGNVEIVPTDLPEPAAQLADVNTSDLLGTVRRYLDEKQMPDAERDALMEIVVELLAAPSLAEDT